MQQIRIDFDNPGLPQSLGAVEGESQSRIFQAALYKSGAAYTAPAGAVYSIMYRGFGPQNQGWYDTIEDGAGKRAACTVSGNVVTCELARQALRVPGHLTVVLCLTDAKGYMLKSWPIMADVRNDGYEDTVEIESFFYITQITSAEWDKAFAAWEDFKATIDPTLTLSGKAADAKATGAAVDKLEDKKADKTDLDTERKRIDVLNEGGLNLKDEVIDTSIKSWLTEHPEATTTVQDGAITEKKINTDFLLYIKKDYVTPEMFGAVGDGVTDDTIAIRNAIKYSDEKNINTVLFSGKKYKITESVGDIQSKRIVGIKDAGLTSKGTVIQLDSDEYIFKLKGISNCIENITFYSTNHTGRGINIERSSGWESHIRNCTFNNLKEAIRYNGNDNRFENCMIVSCGDETCEEADTPQYACDGDNGLQNFFINCHFEHCRYFVTSKGPFNTSFIGCKFEQSTYGISSPNMSSPIKLSYGGTLIGCLIIVISIHGYSSADDAPYGVEAPEASIISGCTFGSGLGSGDYALPTGTLQYSKFLKENRSCVTSNSFNGATKKVSAYNFNGGAVSSNCFNIYASDGGKTSNIDFKTTFFSDNFPAQSDGALTSMFSFSNEYIDLSDRIELTNVTLKESFKDVYTHAGNLHIGLKLEATSAISARSGIFLKVNGANCFGGVHLFSMSVNDEAKAGQYFSTSNINGLSISFESLDTINSGDKIFLILDVSTRL
nr:MAG TPA: tailspike protein [Caudoviricetes sp.]